MASRLAKSAMEVNMTSGPSSWRIDYLRAQALGPAESHALIAQLAARPPGWPRTQEIEAVNVYLSGAAWRTSSYSGGNGGQCVEVATVQGRSDEPERICAVWGLPKPPRAGAHL